MIAQQLLVVSESHYFTQKLMSELAVLVILLSHLQHRRCAKKLLV